eukprot:gene7321-9975_t
MPSTNNKNPVRSEQLNFAIEMVNTYFLFFVVCALSNYYIFVPVYPNFKKPERHIKVLDLSNHQLVSYPTGLDWQHTIRESQFQIQKLFNENTKFECQSTGTLLFLQHKPIYTVGPSSKDGDLPRISSELEYETHPTDRGGQVTYHGPGQVIMYAIIDLSHFEKDIHLYLRNLEEVVIMTLAKQGIIGSRIEGLTGVWVNNSKISAIGIKLSRWITMHGLSLNISPNMKYFENIVPCGISDRSVTSLYDLGIDCSNKNTINYNKFIFNIVNDLIESFCEVFQCEVSSKLINYDAINYLSQLNETIHIE